MISFIFLYICWPYNNCGKYFNTFGGGGGGGLGFFCKSYTTFVVNYCICGYNTHLIMQTLGSGYIIKMEYLPVLPTKGL